MATALKSRPACPSGDRVVLNINNQIPDGSKATVRDDNKVAAK